MKAVLKVVQMVELKAVKTAEGRVEQMVTRTVAKLAVVTASLKDAALVVWLVLNLAVLMV